MKRRRHAAVIGLLLFFLAGAPSAFASSSDAQSLLVDYWLWLSTIFNLVLVAAAALLWRMHSNSRLPESLLDQANDAIYLIDENARFVYVNDSACRALGYSRKELLGMTVSDIDPAIVVDDLAFLYKQSQQTGGAVVIETMHHRRDGSLFPVEIKASTVVYRGQQRGLSLARDITERKQTEAALQASEREFRSLAENMPDNVARWDTEGRYLYINRVYERMLGRKNAEVVGMLIADEHERVKAGVRLAIASGKAFHTMRQRVTIDGVERLHDVSLMPEFDEAGRVISVLGIGRDMTDNYRMQEAIAAREQEFRSLAESSPDHIVRYDLQHRIRYINANLWQLLQPGGAEEVIGKRPEEVWPDGRFAPIEKAAACVIASGEAQTVELIVPMAEGKVRYHQLVVVAERDVSGKIIGTLHFGRDITAIRETERRLSRFVENLPGMAFIFKISPDGTASFPFVSRGIEELYGLKPEDVKADTAALHKLAHPEDRARIEAALARAAGTRGLFHMEFRVCRPDLPERWLEVRSSFELEDEADGSLVWYGIMLDITERKLAERELAESREQLRGLIVQRENAREEERKYIAREIHDELGQILTGLKMGLSVLEQDLAGSPASRRVKELLSLTEMAIAAGRNISAAIRPAELDMGIAAALQWQANRFGMFSGIRWELDIDDEEMPLDGTQAVAVFRIVQEALTNAAKHARASKVGIRMAQEGQDYILKIADNGRGFDMSARKAGSFGLVGMRERVLMLGGELSIDSMPERGTEIFVRFPAQTSEGNHD